MTVLKVLGLFLAVATLTISGEPSSEHKRDGKAFSLFSIVQFPNQQCTGSSSTSTYGTCYTSSECSAKGGSADGNCAAGFGVCCVISTTTCGTALSTNTTYIRNPGYPSSYTASSASTCTYTINKMSGDICQLRLDFQTFSGFAIDASPNQGTCLDTLAVSGQSGVDPPAICGTNTGYHMYAEFGATSTDTLSLTLTYHASGLTTAKTFNILTRQIACDATWKAPTDCTQYFTGVSGSVFSYSYGQMLKSQHYTNCIRTEKGYCSIQWKQSSTTSPDPFGILSPGSTTAASGGNAIAQSCATGFIAIPDLSMTGESGIPVPLGLQAYQSIMCGAVFGVEGQSNAASLTTQKQPFVVGVYTSTTVAETGSGFNLDYTQIPC